MHSRRRKRGRGSSKRRRVTSMNRYSNNNRIRLLTIQLIEMLHLLLNFKGRSWLELKGIRGWLKNRNRLNKKLEDRL